MIGTKQSQKQKDIGRERGGRERRKEGKEGKERRKKGMEEVKRKEKELKYGERDVILRTG